MKEISFQTQSKLVQIEAAHRTIDKALAELAPFGRRYAGSEGKPSILTNIHEVRKSVSSYFVKINIHLSFKLISAFK